MMTRRTTRRGSRRRGLATFLLVTLGVFAMMFVGSIMGTAGGMFAALPSELWAALRYLMTLSVLVIISLRRSGNSGAPACLG